MAAGIIIDTRQMKKLMKDMNIIVRDFPKLGEKMRKRLAIRTKQLAKQNVQPRWAAGYGPFGYQGSTGHLKDSIIFRKDSATSTQIVAEAVYADVVERGTKKHRIPNNFYWGARGRLHPGARPMHFMTKAYNQILKEADGLLGEELSKYFEQKGF